MSKPRDQRYTIAVDFDGVLHRYDSPWINEYTIPDLPVGGALEWVAEMLAAGFDIVIFTTRGKTTAGRDAVHNWLVKHWKDAPLLRLQVTAEKPPALVYLDDRAMRFDGPGTFPTAQQIHAARPWNKR